MMNSSKRTLLLVSLCIAGCAASDSSTNRAPGTTSTTFTTPSGFQISPQSGQSTASHIIFGYFNSDDFLDMILLTGSGALLYTNNSGTSWTRSEISATTGADYSAGVASDLDGDGDSDLILYKNSTGLETYKNDGGTFTKIAELARSENSEMLSYSPAKNGGNLGYILTANSTGNHFVLKQVSFLLNQDTAANVGNSIPKESGVMALQADFNGDGYIDSALVSSSSGSPVQILKNTNDSSMAEIQSFSRSFSGTVRGSMIADLDGDGNRDLLLASSSGIELYTGNGDFTFSASTELSPDIISISASDIVAADFTGDGLLDLFAGRSSSTAKFYGQTRAMVFQDQTSSALGSLTSNAKHVYARDLNNDNELDAIELFSSGKIAIHVNDR